MSNEWKPARYWTRWDAWRMGVIESDSDSGMTWDSTMRPDWQDMNEAYDRGRNVGMAALGREVPGTRECLRCGWPLPADCFSTDDATECHICQDPANRSGNTHVIWFSVEVTMEDMDGTPEQSAEIAYDQVRAALDGEQSQYGLPGFVSVHTREWYEGEREDSGEVVYHASDPRSMG